MSKELKLFTDFWNDVPSLFDWDKNKLFRRISGEFDKILNGKCDFEELEDKYIVELEVPGVDKNNISLKDEKDILTLTGDCSKKPAEGYNCLREDMEYFGYGRSFNLNKSVDPDKIAAGYDNGSLKVKLAKREEQKTKEIKISIN